MENRFSRIIQGCMNWGDWGKKLSKKEMISLMHHNLSCGITSFDHADIYGDYTTEIEFGQAFIHSGIDRENIEIISKCGIQYIGETRKNEIKHYQYDADYIIWSAEKSISDLNASYLDLFLLHRPSPLMHPDEIAKAIDKLLSEGKIKAFGVSNFSPSETELISSKSEVMVNQVQFSLSSPEAMFNGQFNYILQHEIIPMCWSPLGIIFKKENEQTERIVKVLNVLSEKYNATHDQVLLAWILKHPAKIHPVIGTTNMSRITAASKSIEVPLSEIDWFKLLIASQGHKVP